MHVYFLLKTSMNDAITTTSTTAPNITANTHIANCVCNHSIVLRSPVRFFTLPPFFNFHRQKRTFACIVRHGSPFGFYSIQVCLTIQFPFLISKEYLHFVRLFILLFSMDFIAVAQCSLLLEHEDSSLLTV